MRRMTSTLVPVLIFRSMARGYLDDTDDDMELDPWDCDDDDMELDTLEPWDYDSDDDDLDADYFHNYDND